MGTVFYSFTISSLAQITMVMQLITALFGLSFNVPHSLDTVFSLCTQVNFRGKVDPYFKMFPE